jgi:hypothetical protein
MDAPANTQPAERWYEHSSSERVYPVNLHHAQLERRLKSKDSQE